MAQNIYVGNADVDGPLNRGWLLGHFMPEGDVRRSQDVEIKWGVHPAGEERAQWVTHEERTSLHVLISGRFEIRLPDRTVELARPGDYVVLHQTGHSWRSAEPSVVLSVRWPSVPGYAVPGDTAPGNTVPGSTAPGSTAPGSTAPGDTAPGDTAPGNTAPGNTVPGGAVPGGAVPGNTVPGGAVPGNTVPGNTAPGGAAPGSTVPGGAAPGSTVP